MDKINNVVWHDGYINKSDRNRRNGHESGLLLFTGLSGSGKSTIAHCVERELFRNNVNAYVLDGDNVRHGLNKDLSFSPDDRKENLRRIVEMSKLFVDTGIIVLAAFISPYNKDREFIRSSFEGDNYMEVYIKCSIETCEERDPKGLYKKARAGIIKNYTGISSPYEEPDNPELIIDTEKDDLDVSFSNVIGLLEKKRLITLK